MAIKIAVSGTHSTGKTTLLQGVEVELQAQGRTVRRLSSLAVEARDRGFPILRDHTFASTLWIITRGITQELEADIAADVVLVDRPAIDAIGYLDAALKFRRASLSGAERTYLDTLVKHHSATYHCLYKTTVDLGKGIDTTKDRDMDQEFRLDVDQALEDAFAASGIPFDRLDTDPETARLEVIQRAQQFLIPANPQS